MRVNGKTEILKDRIINTYLFCKGYIRNFLKIKKFGNDLPKLKTDPTYIDNFNSLSQDWIIGLPWGKFHPDNKIQYYGDESVYVENNHIIFDHKYLPRDLKTWDSDKVYYIPYSIGVITSTISFGYGYYEFDFKMPKHPGLWPAVWLTGSKSWPPEIDIVEGYSDKDGNYKLQSNIHFNTDKIHENVGARGNFGLDINKSVRYSLYWTKDFIKIYYDGYLVRVITSKKTLKWFDQEMKVVLGTGLREQYIDMQTKEIGKPIAKVELFGFRYWKI